MLRITKQSDYGIVLMTLFASRPMLEARSARDLAHETGLPLPMVGKILKLLVRDGLLMSQRGSKGGYRLGKPAGRITVEEIVRSLEGPIAITECTDNGPGECRFTRACSLQPNWLRINQALRQALQGITLTDMVGSPGGSSRQEEPGAGTLRPPAGACAAGAVRSPAAKLQGGSA